jgi:hypothetical protein
LDIIIDEVHSCFLYGKISEKISWMMSVVVFVCVWCGVVFWCVVVCVVLPGSCFDGKAGRWEVTGVLFLGEAVVPAGPALEAAGVDA